MPTPACGAVLAGVMNCARTSIVLSCESKLNLPCMHRIIERKPKNRLPAVNALGRM